jgi:hypothetical protein
MLMVFFIINTWLGYEVIKFYRYLDGSWALSLLVDFATEVVQCKLIVFCVFNIKRLIVKQ